MMPCMLDSIRPFDVLIASVEFEDKPGVAKPRPVVVLEVDGGTLYVTAVKVTSHAPREWCSGEVVLVDWEREGLAKPSVARCSKIMRLQTDSIRACIGTLTPRDRGAIISGLEDAGAL